MFRDGTEMKTIPGFPNYKITKDGRVWSSPRKYAAPRGQWLIPYIDLDGYSRIYLCRNRRKHNCFIHRLVLETYIGSCPDGMETRHLNGIKKDNRLENLCWGTHLENIKDRTLHGNSFCPRGERCGTAKLIEQNVRMIIYMCRTGLFAQREIALQYGISRATVSDIIRRKSWKHIWKDNVA